MIAKMQTEVGADGYERKMHELLAECGGVSFKPNLDASALLKWLTLFHVNSAKDHSMSNMTKTYAKGGKASTLDGIVFGIVSQFTIHNASGDSSIIQSESHKSELNMLRLTCIVVEKNSVQQGQPQPPVCAYLSSDMLDQCVKKVGRFPSTDEFLKFLQSTKDAEPTPPFEPLSPSFWVTPTSYEGGKRSRRIMRKKRTRVKNRRHSRHRR